MTRETKVGIVVSCSFLSLLGVVLVSKLKGSSVENQPEPNQVEETALPSPEPLPPGSLAQANPPSVGTAASSPASELKAPTGAPAVLPASFDHAPPPPSSPSTGPSLPLPGEAGSPPPFGSQAGTSGGQTAPSGTSVSGPRMTKETNALAARGAGGWFQNGGSSTASTPPPAGSGSAGPASGSMALPPAVSGQSPPPTQPNQQPDTQTTANEGSADKDASKQKTLISAIVPSPEAMNIAPAPDPVKTGSQATVTLLEGSPGAAGAATRPGAGTKDGKATPTLLLGSGPKDKDPALAAGTPRPEDKRNTDAPSLNQPFIMPVAPVSPPSRTVAPVPEVAADAGKTPAPAPAGGSSVILPRSDTTSKNVQLETPAARAAPTQVALGPAPTPTARLAPAVPEVDSFDEAIYTCQPGDTFASIAAKYYPGAVPYGDALLWYNRNHPDAGDGIRQDPPVLSGQRVYIPLEKRVLEQRYPKLIPGLPAPAVPAAPAAPPPSASSAAPNYPQYRVTQPEGETMFEIAKRTLGNGFRWKEIAALNPNLASDFAVEANKVLRLPPDARVDADHVPR
jgi:hypothetical protein